MGLMGWRLSYTEIHSHRIIENRLYIIGSDFVLVLYLHTM